MQSVWGFKKKCQQEEIIDRNVSIDDDDDENYDDNYHCDELKVWGPSGP